MTAGAYRWNGYCHGCRRLDREVETHYERAAKTLCDACAGTAACWTSVGRSSSHADRPGHRAARRDTEGGMTANVERCTSCDTAYEDGAPGCLCDYESLARTTTATEGSATPSMPLAQPASAVTSTSALPSASASPSPLLKERREPRAAAEPHEHDEADGFHFTDRLIEEYAAGLLEPLAVSLRPLPGDAPPLTQRVAEDFRLVRGLRLAVGEARAVPYAYRWVAKRIRAGETSTWAAIAYLVRVGVLEPAKDPEFHARGGKRRIRLYLPADLVPVEAPPVAVEVAHDQPQHEDVDVSAVPRAEVAVDRVPREVGASVRGAYGGDRLTHGLIVPRSADEEAR
jgi:hypothetical protein